MESSAPKVRILGLQRQSTIQKAREWQAFYAQKKEILWNQDWLAGAAVGFEPVSGMDSLLTGNFTGNIAIVGLKNPILEQETAAPPQLLG